MKFKLKKKLAMRAGKEKVPGNDIPMTVSCTNENFSLKHSNNLKLSFGENSPKSTETGFRQPKILFYSQFNDILVSDTSKEAKNESFGAKLKIF